MKIEDLKINDKVEGYKLYNNTFEGYFTGRVLEIRTLKDEENRDYQIVIINPIGAWDHWMDSRTLSDNGSIWVHPDEIEGVI